MNIDQNKVGKQIALLRSEKKLTQSELGERIGVSFQAVSKWERGETLPDVSVLPDLADVLEMTIDQILLGGEREIRFKGKIKVQDMIDGLRCLQRMGELLGRSNIIYRYAIQGIETGMNAEIEPAFTDDFIFEAFVAEAIIQCLKAGSYVDITDVKRSLKYEHFQTVVSKYANKYGIV